MPDLPKLYRIKPTETEARFTIETSQNIPHRTFAMAPTKQTGVGTIYTGVGGIDNLSISESVAVDKDKVGSSTQTISESVEVVVT